MTALAPIALRLGQLIRLLSSDNDGEVVAAVRAIDRTLKAAGADIHALADLVERPPTPVGYRPPPRNPSAPPTWAKLTLDERQAFLDRVRFAEWASPWEMEFSSSIYEQFMLRGGDRLSPKQIAALDRLLAKAFEYGEVAL